MKINKKIEYALMALKFMAQKEKNSLTTAREICDHFNTPFDTVSKVMQSLNSQNILNSVKGIKGGYSLNIDLDKVSYKEIENIIEGKSKEEDHVCQSAKGMCDLYSTCNIIGPVEKLNTHVNAFLSNLTLKELLLEEINNGEIRE